jgi:hypothetical protein
MVAQFIYVVVPARRLTVSIILYIENSSNITVNGLKFTVNWGISAEGIVVRGSGNAITIKNCEFYDIGWEIVKPHCQYRAKMHMQLLLLAQIQHHTPISIYQITKYAIVLPAIAKVKRWR